VTRAPPSQQQKAENALLQKAAETEAASGSQANQVWRGCHLSTMQTWFHNQLYGLQDAIAMMRAESIRLLEVNKPPCSASQTLRLTLCQSILFFTFVFFLCQVDAHRIEELSLDKEMLQKEVERLKNQLAAALASPPTATRTILSSGGR